MAEKIYYYDRSYKKETKILIDIFPDFPTIILNNLIIF